MEIKIYRIKKMDDWSQIDKVLQVPKRRDAGKKSNLCTYNEI